MKAYIVAPGGVLRGAVRVPGDKSITHRALILGSLIARGPRIRLHNWSRALDCQSTLAALQAMGVEAAQISEYSVEIKTVGLYGLQQPRKILDVGNSGTALRLLTGVLAAQKFSSVITGDASLGKRPMRRIIEPLTQMGASITAVAGQFAPLNIIGNQKLCSINYTMAIASAQVKSAILLADLYAGGNSTIIEPQICRDHTEIMLQTLGGGATDLFIPGDISAAAFFIVGASIAPNSKLTIKNVGINPTRTGIIKILRLMGANIDIQQQRDANGELRADLLVSSAKLRGIVVPLDLVPNAIDELPVILLAAACADGVTEIRGAAELRYKESDRIALMAQGLTKLGIKVTVYEDGLAVEGGQITGGEVESAGDHRIAMTFAMAALVAHHEIIIQDTHNVATSFPNFAAIAEAAGLLICEESVYA